MEAGIKIRTDFLHKDTLYLRCTLRVTLHGSVEHQWNMRLMQIYSLKFLISKLVKDISSNFTEVSRLSCCEQKSYIETYKKRR